MCVKEDCIDSELNAQSCHTWPCASVLVVEMVSEILFSSGEGTCHSSYLISHKMKVGYLS